MNENSFVAKVYRQFGKILGVKSQTISLREHNTLMPLLGGGFNWGTDSRQFLTEAYRLNPYVFMVVDRIVQRAISFETKFVKADDHEQEIEIPQLDEVLESPNKKEDYSEFLYRVYASYLVGEVFIVAIEELGEPVQFIVPISYNVTINEDVRGNVISYTINRFNEVFHVLPSKVQHIKKPNITRDSNNGFSPLMAGRKVWESNNEVWASEASLHRNKGISGVLGVKGSGRPMTPSERSETQAQYEKESTGTDKFGGVRIVGSEPVFVQMGMNPNDLKSLDTRLEHLRTICALYNVDSKLFNDPTSSTYNNMAEAEKAMIIKAALPLVEKVNPKLIAFIAKQVSINTGRVLGLNGIAWIVDENTIPELSRPNLELSGKIIAEVNAGILTAQQGTELLYPDLAGNQNDNGN